MSYQVLARKWRPVRFDDVVGQEPVVRALRNALNSGRLHHAYLFSGTRGTGKTTLARIFARCLNCETGVTASPCGQCATCREIDEGRFVDLIEVDAASRTRVDDTRDLLDNVQYAATRGRFKVYLIDEVHMLSAHSFNALLKTLEEPPDHVKFLLATTDPHKIPITVLSRCLQFALRKVSPERVAAHLGRILAAEETEGDPVALSLIANAADGSVRDALSLLDQALAYGAGALRETDVRDMLGTIDSRAVERLLATLADEDVTALRSVLDDMASLDPDYDEVLKAILRALHEMGIEQLAGEGRASPPAVAGRLSPEQVQLFYQIALIGRRDLPYAPDARTGFEMTLLRMLAFRLVDARAGLALHDRADAKAAAAGPADRSTPKMSSGSGAGPATATATAMAMATHSAAAREHETPSLETLVLSWGQWARQIPAAGLVREIFLNSAAQVTDGRLALAIDASCAHLATRERLAAAREALERFVPGLVVTVALSQGAEQTPARAGREVEESRAREAQEALAQDPGVLALQEQFGARVVPGSVKPRR